jgi:hypothetical protein
MHIFFLILLLSGLILLYLHCVFLYKIMMPIFFLAPVAVWSYLVVLLILELFFKLFEDGFNELCSTYGVYMVLYKQRWWNRFECRWAVGRQKATVVQEMVGRLYRFPWTGAMWGGYLVYFV